MSIAFPLHFWDSRAIWALKAKMLFSDGTIFSPNFLDPLRIQPHFRYPLLFPLAQAFIFFTLGLIDDWAIMLLIGLFFPLMCFLLFDLIRIATGQRLSGLLGAAMLAVLPVYYFCDGPALWRCFFLSGLACFFFGTNFKIIVCSFWGVWLRLFYLW